MAHKFSENPADGSGSFTDIVSGKVYEFAGGKRRAENKTAAKQALLRDQAAMERAALLRPRTKPPTREEKIINTPRSEKLASVRHIATTATGESMADRNIAYHQNAVNEAKTDAERSQAMRRLSAAQAAKEKIVVGEARRDARQAQLDDPKLAEATQRAASIYQDLLMRPDVDSLYVDMAKRNLLELKHSRNYEAYAQSERELEQRFNFERDAKLANMNASVTLAKQEIKGFAAQPGIVPEAEGGSDD
jgi:hypothetical protein